MSICWQALMCTLPTIPTLWDMVPVQAPMLSIFRVAFNFRCTLPYDMFPNIDRIGNIACPVLVIHGVKDEVVPFWNGEQLFLCAPVSLRAKPLWVPDGGHNDLEDVLRYAKYTVRAMLVMCISKGVPKRKRCCPLSTTACNIVYCICNSRTLAGRTGSSSRAYQIFSPSRCLCTTTPAQPSLYLEPCSTVQQPQYPLSPQRWVLRRPPA